MKFVRRSWPYGLLVVLLIAGGVLLWRHDEIIDWAITHGYRSSAEIQQLAADTTMTPLSQRLFYVNKPVVEGRSSFSQHCKSNRADQAATLGCFTGNRSGIYIYKVTEPELAGVEQVTAAHEMLHQGYQRLNRTTRVRVDSMLQDYYAHHLTDSVVKDQLQNYTKSEPGQLLNEMHSIFGTEIAALPQPLEDYYKQYFNNRSKVAQYYQNYQSAFDQRNKQIEVYEAQLSTLNSQIAAGKSDLDARESVIQSQRAQLNVYKAAGQITLYNDAVPGFNALIDAYRAEVNQVNGYITQYNQILNERNGIAFEEQQLQQALDSRVTDATSQ